MSAHIQNPLHHPEVEIANGKTYLLNFILSVVLMTVAFLSVRLGISPFGAFLLTTALAGGTVIIQSYLILHMDTSKTQIWHSFSMLLFLPLFVVTIGLTAWMFHGLYQRTMIMPSGAGMSNMSMRQTAES
ncbi:cytochrome O ubiquinol oxidase [Acidithiobacillus sp. AMEEHan]|uniref:cytochrome O ubiquinol oxidase n=1 Tax=Acidithiobacillus sp. AMEEHan TaxID=2994951 RepID=UPI0027E51B16|nr:cytochrome O ubiquinol oxidase [Acidithiobacillus sp. AMEEHan]